MSPATFVEGLIRTVHIPAIKGSVSELEAGPPGRNPAGRSVQLSKWYRGLPPSDREMVHAAVAKGVHAAMFGFFAVLDGVRVIDDGGATRIELCSLEGANRVQLNDPSGEMLHDIYQGLAYDGVFGGESP